MQLSHSHLMMNKAKEKSNQAKAKLDSKKKRKKLAKAHLMAAMHIKTGMDAAFALESQEEQEAQMKRMREQIENHDEKVEFDRLAKEKFDAKISKDKINMAQQLQKEAREKKRSHSRSKASFRKCCRKF